MSCDLDNKACDYFVSISCVCFIQLFLHTLFTVWDNAGIGSHWDWNYLVLTAIFGEFVEDVLRNGELNKEFCE